MYIDDKEKLAAYESLPDSEKVKRLEYWASHYLMWLNVATDEVHAKAFIASDCIDHYENELKTKGI